jgi:Protein of unknown function (DUF4435)
MTEMTHSDRLTHNHSAYEAYLRKMQVSSNQIFVFVEGKTNDPYFYGEICRSVCESQGLRYRIKQAKQLPGETGGKKSLLDFLDYLNNHAALFSDFQNKKTIAIFFLDKDVDDCLGEQRHSDHLIYTKYYDVENHIFREGDLGKASAVAASMDRQVLVAGLGNYEAWRRNVAERWKDWVKLCLFARVKNIDCKCNYGSTSRINNVTIDNKLISLYGPRDLNAYRECLTLLETKSGLATVEFQNDYQQISDSVDEIYATGEYDRVFKGKWYAGLLEATIKTLAGNIPFNSKGLQDRLLTNITSTLDFDKAWAEHFKVPLRSLIEKMLNAKAT